MLSKILSVIQEAVVINSKNIRSVTLRVDNLHDIKRQVDDHITESRLKVSEFLDEVPSDYDDTYVMAKHLDDIISNHDEVRANGVAIEELDTAVHGKAEDHELSEVSKTVDLNSAAISSLEEWRETTGEFVTKSKFASYKHVADDFAHLVNVKLDKLDGLESLPKQFADLNSSVIEYRDRLCDLRMTESGNTDMVLHKIDDINKRIDKLDKSEDTSLSDKVVDTSKELEAMIRNDKFQSVRF